MTVVLGVVVLLRDRFQSLLNWLVVTAPAMLGNQIFHILRPTSAERGANLRPPTSSESRLCDQSSLQSSPLLLLGSGILPQCANTIRTAGSQTSRENEVGFPGETQPTQNTRSPENPLRFSPSCCESAGELRGGLGRLRCRPFGGRGGRLWGRFRWRGLR